MKKMLIGVLAALLSFSALATTLTPVQLLNPSGSTSGQAILSTGASSAPAWGNVSAAALTGVVPVVNGGTNASSASGTALDNITGFSGTGFLTRTGAGTYAFQSATNGITLGNLAQSAANTVLANATGSTANVAAFSMPSCSTSASALNWTSGTGFACNSSVNAATLGGATFAAPGAIGSTTASTGRFTTLQATSAITPSSTAGIVGTATNDSANAGSVGELISSNILVGSSVSLSSGVVANVTSISLTAGNWMVWGNVVTNPAGTTTTQSVGCGISTTTAAFPTAPGGGAEQILPITGAASQNMALSCGQTNLKLAGTTTVFLVAQVYFGVSTMGGYGFIGAIRIR